MGIRLGIDFGTNYICASYVDEDGNLHRVFNIGGEEKTPAAVYLGSDGVTVGEEALRSGAECPEFLSENIKRYLQDTVYTFNARGDEYTPTQIAAYIFRQILSDAEHCTDEKIECAVLTCPAYFGAEGHAAMLRIANSLRLSNGEPLYVPRIICEHEAAVLAYAHFYHESEAEKTVVLCDLGASLDLYLIEFSRKNGKTEPRIINYMGDHYFGGKDWNTALTNMVCEKFYELTGEDDYNMLRDPAFRADIGPKIERAKRMLSVRDETSVLVKYGGQNENISVTRAQFEEATGHLLAQVGMLMDHLFENCGRSIEEADEIVPTGGSAHMPQVGAYLRSAFNRKICLLEPDMAVSIGAALYASNLRRDDF